MKWVGKGSGERIIYCLEISWGIAFLEMPFIDLWSFSDGKCEYSLEQLRSSFELIVTATTTKFKQWKMEMWRTYITPDPVFSPRCHLPEGLQHCQKRKTGISRWLGWHGWHRYMRQRKHAQTSLTTDFWLCVDKATGANEFYWTVLLFVGRLVWFCSDCDEDKFGFKICSFRDGDSLNELIWWKWVQSPTAAWQARTCQGSGGLLNPSFSHFCFHCFIMLSIGELCCNFKIKTNQE